MTEEALLIVHDRTGKPKAERRNGFIPCIIYGSGIKESIPAKLEASQVRRMFGNSIKNARTNIKIGNEIKYCIVKDTQRHATTGEVIHIDLQAVSKDEPIKINVPVQFEGRGLLDSKGLILEVFIPEVTLYGRVDLLPEYIVIDVGNRIDGDKITVKDIQIDSSIKILNDKDEILASINAPKGIDVEEGEEEGEAAEG